MIAPPTSPRRERPEVREKSALGPSPQIAAASVLIPSRIRSASVGTEPPQCRSMHGFEAGALGGLGGRHAPRRHGGDRSGRLKADRPVRRLLLLIGEGGGGHVAAIGVVNGSGGGGDHGGTIVSAAREQN